MNESQFRSRIMPLHRRLFAYALSILGDESDAADCIQEALTKLWEQRGRLANMDNIEAYAITVVRNLCLNIITRHRSHLERISDTPPDLSDRSPGPLENLESHEEIKALAAMIRELPENQRRVVMMSAVSGLSNTEIRKATGLSDDNVRVLLSRGRKKLRLLFTRFLNEDRK